MKFPEILITVADKCPANHGMEPTTNRAEKTITMHQYDVLTEMPYQLTYKQLKEEVHRTRRGKEFTDEQLETYMMKRSELCKIYGWGVHEDKNGTLALVGCETKEYRRLVRKPGVERKKAFNPSASSINTFHNRFPNL